MTELNPHETALLQSLHSSLAVRFGTDAPYKLGRPEVVNIGFAHIPYVAIPVDVPAKATGALVPIARQRCYSFLGEQGLSPDVVDFTPTLYDRTMYYGGRPEGLFENENESASCPVGARKRGRRLWYLFEITDKALVYGPTARISFMGGTIGRWKEAS